MAETMKLDGSRQLDFDRESVEQAYDRWAPIYDAVCGPVMVKGRRAAAIEHFSCMPKPVDKRFLLPFFKERHMRFKPHRKSGGGTPGFFSRFR